MIDAFVAVKTGKKNEVFLTKDYVGVAPDPEDYALQLAKEAFYEGREDKRAPNMVKTTRALFLE